MLDLKKRYLSTSCGWCGVAAQKWLSSQHDVIGGQYYGNLNNGVVCKHLDVRQSGENAHGASPERESNFLALHRVQVYDI